MRQQNRRRDPTPPGRRVGRIMARRVGEFFLYVVIALVVMALVKGFVIAPFRVPTESMQQTIEPKDEIVAWKPGAPVRGQIVVFEDEQHWLPPSVPVPWWKTGLSYIGLYPPTDKQYLVKRLIGLPGDRVTCCDSAGRITVNGKALDEASYLYQTAPGQTVVPSVVAFDIVVPEGRMFVLGDHRNDSSDSRAHLCSGTTSTPDLAFPTLASIQGRAVAIISPRSRWRTYSIPPTFADVPPATGTPPSVALAQGPCPLGSG